jgi:hypothetical protein
MGPNEGLKISIPGEVVPVEACSIWDDPEQRALGVALAAEFERWAAHNAIAETCDVKPLEPWTGQWSPTVTHTR